jgi:hypothetical protein
MSAAELRENVSEDRPGTEQSELLSRKINELSLAIPGTRLEALILQLYVELERAGISFKPKTYLSDEWGCPNGVPVIGIPFYLADVQLARLEGQLTDIEAENEAEVVMYLRHEAGHAFNYAYRLYTKLAWRRLFGSFSRPYKENYRPHPFSARFVHHIPGWYAQKHPDEDFAETFAVWLTPDSGWRERYADTPALAKLLYVNRVARRYGRQPPIVTAETVDTPVEELTMTLDTWYAADEDSNSSRLALHNVIDDYLKMLFPGAEGQPAADVLKANRRGLIRDVNHWTGMDRHVLSSLYNDLRERVQFLGLKTDPDQATTRMVSMAVFLTTLVMNYQRTGRFIEL